ncbi:MarR family winged helix-turn-helix transcriptional regulator [Microbacterium sp. MPKO10]|uniref:MarR family winged helix-turn-helix transcriptional regulator n=1 Tax=Microbacterium sp. MPKO10 TaxID=2989818 RepID=UPI0022364EE8|nr:MarR family transcriptional regulator [Microbacterium sp. MPKO10]MCW4456879.1 MarR family transcriptional regulator [Microbacterium sp. MPKO10]
MDSVDTIIAQWNAVKPGLDVSAMGIIGRISRLEREHDAQMRQVFDRHNLLRGEFDILATLVRADPHGDGLTAGQLTAQTMVTSGAITNRLDRLVAKGYVTREVDPENRRSIRVELTREGRAVVDAALVDHVANEERMLQSLSSSQRASLSSILSQLLAAHEGAAK